MLSWLTVVLTQCDLQPQELFSLLLLLSTLLAGVAAVAVALAWLESLPRSSRTEILCGPWRPSLLSSHFQYEKMRARCFSHVASMKYVARRDSKRTRRRQRDEKDKKRTKDEEMR